MGNINSVLILASDSKPEGKPLSEEITSYLCEKGIKVETKFFSNTEGKMDISADIDLVITLGGDGTVLYAARSAAENAIPVLPINLGTFGYITEIEKNEWKDSLEAYLDGKENISQRLMLKVSCFRNGEEVFFSRGLNDMVICASGIAKMIYLNLNMDNTSAGNFRCDGMIVATPTGSTGYSLAAGGPILEASMEALVITPISPFTLSNRPVVTGEKEIHLNVCEKQRTKIVLTVDGQVCFDLQEGDEVVVKMSSKRLSLIKSTKRNFTEVIRDKLKWAGEMKNNA